MAGISVRGNADRVALKLQSRASRLHLRNRLAMERVTLKLERDLKRDALTGTAGSNDLFGKVGAAGDALATVTGQAKQTLVRRVFAKTLQVVGVLVSPLAYIRLHEVGGVVRGKQYLRIPTKFAKTGAGADRNAGRGARAIENTAIFRSRSGNLWIWEVGTARAKASPRGIIPLYLLKPSIKLRARHMFRNTLTKNRRYIREQFVAVAAYLATGR